MNHKKYSSVGRDLHDGISRREAMKTIGAAAGLAMAGLRFGGVARGADQPATAPASDALGPVAPRVTPFALAEVKLEEGPFRQAQLRTAKYLLSLEPDRMLHNFRVNAGLAPKAAVYGGWESVKIWADIRAQGHTLGHYLSACAMMYAATGTPAFKDRVAYIAGELRDCQEAGKSGLTCAFPEGAAVFDAALTGKRLTGVPWYTMHKIFAGLRDGYLFCGDETARKVLVALADWAVEFTSPISDELFQHMLNVEHGGMNEVLADVHVITGDGKYLAAAERFCHRAILEPLAQSRDILNGLHANTQIPKVIGFQRLYELTGRGEYGAAALFFWQRVVNERSFCTGGHGDNEHFFPPADFGRHVGGAKNMETCCDYNMLRLTRALFAHDPSAAYADYYELALYNGILASQDPDSGMMTYFQGTRPGYMKLYCTPVDSFWCCTGTGMENHAKYGDSIYFHDEGSLYVNLFIASSVQWKEKGVKVHQSTEFPNQGKTTLRVDTASPVEFTLQVRHPGWCKKVSITRGDGSTVESVRPGSYVAVRRIWKSGDVVEVDLPMELRAVPLPHAPRYVAYMCGPIVLAGVLGNEGIAPGADLIVNERTYGAMLNQPFETPRIAADTSDALKNGAVAKDEPLTFSIARQGGGEAIRLAPYYTIAHERYCIYWKIAEA